MSLPPRHEFTVYRGDDSSIVADYLDADLNPIDLTGVVATFEVRAYRGAPDPALLSYASPSAQLSVDGPAGRITLAFPRADVLAFAAGEYVCDLRIVGGGKITTIATGPFVVAEKVGP